MGRHTEVMGSRLEHKLTRCWGKGARHKSSMFQRDVGRADDCAKVPEAKLSKKHLGICYHAVREASAAKIWQVGFIKGKHNIADCLTKILSGTVLEKQVTQWMYRK